MAATETTSSSQEADFLRGQLGSRMIELYKPSLASKEKIGFFSKEVSSQTHESDLLDLKDITTSFQSLLKEFSDTKRDLYFAKHALQADYEARMDDRASELYCRLNDRLADVEKLHADKVQIVRKSYRTQLANCCCLIAAEYKAYYDGILSGKFDRHDAKLKDVQKQNEDLKQTIQQNESVIQMLQMQLHQSKTEKETMEEYHEEPLYLESTEPDGISFEEAEELHAQIEDLQNELDELKSTIAAKETSIRKLSYQLDQLREELEEEKAFANEMKRDSEKEKQKVAKAAGTAAQLADKQLAVLREEMEKKLEGARKKGFEDALVEAEKQRRTDENRFEGELARRCALEDRLKREKENLEGEGAVFELKRLQKSDKEQKERIIRLQAELERVNKMWQVKFAVLQRTLHAVKNESYLRANLQRQSARLHHATVTYAHDAPYPADSHGTRKSLPRIETQRSLAEYAEGTISTEEQDRPKSHVIVVPSVNITL